MEEKVVDCVCDVNSKVMGGYSHLLYLDIIGEVYNSDEKQVSPQTRLRLFLSLTHDEHLHIEANALSRRS